MHHLKEEVIENPMIYCNANHLWIPALKDLGPLLLPVIDDGSDVVTILEKEKTRPEKQSRTVQPNRPK